VPIGSWLAATFLDFAGGRASRPAAQRLIAFGAVAALPTAFTGASDWVDTTGAERRVGLVHAAMNYTALATYTASWLARRRGRHTRGVALAIAGLSVLGIGGWLGGHLSYALGVGVDTTAFEQLPTEWTDVAAESDVSTTPLLADADGVPVLLVRDGGSIVAIADRCTHRGAPLHEGDVADGCVTCPWHSSRFRLADGSVVQGPATRPQPVFEVLIADERVSVRRAQEPRALRTNPVGS
jgi:nitrite reductase/ring-hydroxylating ferredoxin subunit